jgi:hypothetical protein
VKTLFVLPNVGRSGEAVDDLLLARIEARHTHCLAHSAIRHLLLRPSGALYRLSLNASVPLNRCSKKQQFVYFAHDSCTTAGPRRRQIMKTLRVLDSSGDLAISFDDTEATARARAKARGLFERMLARHFTAFKVHRAKGQPDEKVTEFDALENETILVPRIVGG